MASNLSNFENNDEQQSVQVNAEIVFPPPHEQQRLIDEEMLDSENDATDDDSGSIFSRNAEEQFDDEYNEMSLQDPYASSTSKLNAWDYRSRLAPGESEKEYSMFCLYRDSGSGRSTTYISLTYNLSDNRIQKIAAKNNWGKRVADYDKYQLQLLLKEEASVRALEHKKKLEEYRLQQEFLGRSLTADAAKLAAIVSRSLDKFIAADGEIDIKDVPGILAAATKAGDIGKNLQASSLGVEQLLAALEEVED